MVYIVGKKKKACFGQYESGEGKGGLKNDVRYCLSRQTKMVESYSANSGRGGYNAGIHGTCMDAPSA